MGLADDDIKQLFELFRSAGTQSRDTNEAIQALTRQVSLVADAVVAAARPAPPVQVAPPPPAVAPIGPYTQAATAMGIIIEGGEVSSWGEAVAHYARETIGKADPSEGDIQSAIGRSQGHLWPLKGLIEKIAKGAVKVGAMDRIAIATRVNEIMTDPAWKDEDQDSIVTATILDFYSGSKRFKKKPVCADGVDPLVVGARLYYYAVIEQAGLFRTVDDLDARWEARTVTLNTQLGTLLNNYTARPQEHVQPGERAQYYLRAFGDTIVPPLVLPATFSTNTTFTGVWNTFIRNFSQRSRQGTNFADFEVTDRQLIDSAEELIADLQSSLDGREVAGALRLDKDVVQVEEILKDPQHLEILGVPQAVRGQANLIAEVLVKAPAGDFAARTLFRKAKAGQAIIDTLASVTAKNLTTDQIKKLGALSQQWLDATGSAPTPT